MFARGQLREFLDDAHALNEIDIGTARNAQVGLFDAVGGVGKDVERTGEAEVLGVVGREVDTDALGVVDVGGVFNEETIKTDARTRGDGADEGVLQQAHFVFVDVHIGEAVLEDGAENVARIEEVVDAAAALAEHNALVGMGRAAIDFARHVFIDRDGEDELAGFVARFHMVFEEGHLLEFAFLEDFVGDVVEGKREFRIFVDGVIVVELEVAHLLGFYHLAHELNGWVVFARVLGLVARHNGRSEFGRIVVELHVIDTSLLHLQGLRGIANHRHAHFSGLEGQGITACFIGARVTTSLDGDIGKRQGFTGLGVGDNARDALRHGGKRHEGDKDEGEK